MPELLNVARIVSTHGLKGNVKVELLTDFDSRLAKGQKLMLKGQWVTVQASQWQNGRLVLKLSGVDDIDQAKALQWEYLSVNADEEPELDADEFLVEDLVGLTVMTTEGKNLGVVDEVAAYPAQDILMIGDLMIPFAQEFVKEIDFDKETITVELLEGMLDIAESRDS